MIPCLVAVAGVIVLLNVVQLLMSELVDIYMSIYAVECSGEDGLVSSLLRGPQA